MEKGKRLVPPEERFYEMTLDLLDHVRDIVGDDNVNYIDKIRCFIEFMDYEDVIDIFIRNRSTNFPIIKNKDKFALMSSFGHLSDKTNKKLTKVCSVLFSEDTGVEEVEELWSRFTKLVRCSINYMYEIELDEDTIEELAREWGVDLGIQIYITDDESDSE